MRYLLLAVVSLATAAAANGHPAWGIVVTRTCDYALSVLPPSLELEGVRDSQSPGIRPVLSSAEPPAGAKAGGVKWITVTSPNLGVMLAAVATPSGPGPFTTVIILHGSHGFAHEYVELAAGLADLGVQAMAVCWFSGSSGGAGLRFVTPIACPQAPPIPMASSKQALDTVDTLLQAARQLPGTRHDRIALFGHSRGGGAVLNYILRYSSVYAAILNSTGYPPELTTAAGELRARTLILHGTADSKSDGGSAMTSVAMARDFEAAVRRAGKRIEAHYYPAARHNEIVTSKTHRIDSMQRIIRFLQQPDSAARNRGLQ